ncbi:hypothetical protein [Streptomyces lasiicapitis]|uniref:hypothetical protein n=1 Tax=Streptomyces lasiicapitis TaxID=1923961 RepID=UPI003674C6BB
MRRPVAAAPTWESTTMVGTADPEGWATSQLAGIAAGSARLHSRTRLTAVQWPGDVERAARVAAVLVDIAVRHGGTVRVPMRLAVIGTGELLIEAADSVPTFPGYAETLAWEPAEPERRRPGLWQARHFGATLAYAATGDGTGRTVQAVLTPAEVSS